MSMCTTTTDDFGVNLTTLLPRLRVYALSLTRDGDRADDLVQQTACKALAGRESFRPGTNFPGWLFRIQRNEFISGLRRARPTVDIDGEVGTELSHPPSQESGLVVQEVLKAFRRLSTNARRSLLLSGLAGESYEEIGRKAGIAVGTVKSRVSRGRSTLGRMLELETTPRRRSKFVFTAGA